MFNSEIIQINASRKFESGQSGVEGDVFIRLNTPVRTKWIFYFQFYNSDLLIICEIFVPRCMYIYQ